MDQPAARLTMARVKRKDAGRRRIRSIPLRVDFSECAVPVETAMIRAGFSRPDADDRWLSGYLLIDGQERYHEAAMPEALVAGRRVVEVTVDFRMTFQPAEAPCPTSPSSSRNTS